MTDKVRRESQWGRPLGLDANSPHPLTVGQRLGTPRCMAKFLHCVCTACMLRTQRLRYSPKNTCHLV